jgi:hypothetical protein
MFSGNSKVRATAFENNRARPVFQLGFGGGTGRREYLAFRLLLGAVHLQDIEPAYPQNRGKARLKTCAAPPAGRRFASLPKKAAAL